MVGGFYFWWVTCLASVFYAEYIVVDLNDPRVTFAIIGLIRSWVCHLLDLCVALRGAGLRLYLTLPVLFFDSRIGELADT